MNLQALLDRYYHAAYDKIWQQHAAGAITADEAVDRCHTASERAWARIKRETGYEPSCKDPQPASAG